MPSSGKDVWYEDFIRERSRRALVSAAEACADAISLKFPPPSREANRRAYQRELHARFEAAVRDLNEAWTSSDDDSGTNGS